MKKPPMFRSIEAWKRDLEDEIRNYTEILNAGKLFDKKLTKADREFYERCVSENQAFVDAINQGKVKS